MPLRSLWTSALLCICLCACSDDAPAGDGLDAGASDAGADALQIEKSTMCASSFGSALTPGFGRVDGTLLAVVGPRDRQCVMPNDDHVVVQVSVGGAAHRMVVNVESSRGEPDPRVAMAEIQAPLVGSPFEEGWHVGVNLDYPLILGVRSDAFTPYAFDPLVERIESFLELGAPISVYATSGAGRPESAHLIHRGSRPGQDGAIVVNPTSPNPTYLLFRFQNQEF